MGDSNSRPDGPKPPALPTALIPDFWLLSFCARCGQTCGHGNFLTTSACGGSACIAGVSRDCGDSVFRLEGGATRSQSRRATNCATPGYSVYLSGWAYSPKSSAIPTSLYPDIWFCGGVNLYVGRCVRETPPARQRHGALTVQTGFVRGGLGETTLILPCSAGKSNRVQADFLPAPCFA